MATILPTPAIRGERVLLGIALRIGFATAFAGMSALLKLANQRGVAAEEMLFYRTIFGLPIVIAWVLAGPGLRALGTKRPLAHLTRSGIGIVSILATFKALTLLPLADASTIGFTAPLFATILSALVLAERVGPHRWAAVAIGFVGMLIVVRPGGGGLPLAGVAVGLVSAIGTAMVTITIRQIGRTEHVAAIVFWFFVLSATAGAMLLPFVGRSHPPEVYLLLAAAGTLGGAMQLMMTGSLRHAPVGTVAPFDYIQLVWAIALGWALFGTVPGGHTIAGAAIIAASGIYTIWREQKLHRGIPAATPPLE